MDHLPDPGLHAGGPRGGGKASTLGEDLKLTFCHEELNADTRTELSGSSEKDVEFFPEEVMSDLGWKHK